MQEKENRIYAAKEEAVIRELMMQPVCYQQFRGLNERWQKRFLDFYTGKKTLPLTYDPFFKRIFHPDLHPGRLSRFLSCLLEKEMKVVRILPLEENLFLQEALLIMDILVELNDGSLANVEVQKIPYFFPAERMSCYSADLLMRQYSRVKGERGKGFKYCDVNKVYTIVLFEKSSKLFHEGMNHYLHRGKTTFDTGLKLELLQEYCLVALDVFRKILYDEGRNERRGWISLLATENVEEALRLAEEYPWLEEIYKEMETYMTRTEEVLEMFLEALRVMDQNTVRYMIEEQQEQLSQQLQLIDEQHDKLDEQSRMIDEQDDKLNEQSQLIDEQHDKLNEQREEINKKDCQISKQRAEMMEQARKIQEQEEELIRLKKLLEKGV